MQCHRADILATEGGRHIICPHFPLHEDDGERHAVAILISLLHLLIQQQHHIVDLIGVCRLLQALRHVCCGCAHLSDLHDTQKDRNGSFTLLHNGSFKAVAVRTS